MSDGISKWYEEEYEKNEKIRFEIFSSLDKALLYHCFETTKKFLDVLGNDTNLALTKYNRYALDKAIEAIDEINKKL